MRKKPSENLLVKDGVALYIEKLFSADECAYFFEHLSSALVWQQEPIVIFGKPVMQPRLTALAGDPGIQYRYSGITMQAQPWTKELLEIKKRIEPLAQTTFNTALLNLYRHQTDSMGWHRDNEKSLGPEPTIGSVSFGATREFRFRHYTDRSASTSIELEDGSFLLMQGSTQSHWQHCIPKKSAPVAPRINLTFRTILD
jgi:alkylated DNA repair dioxygenase AlkB